MVRMLTHSIGKEKGSSVARGALEPTANDVRYGFVVQMLYVPLPV